MTDTDSLERLQREFDRLGERMSGHPDAAARLQLKDDIIALFRRSEIQIERLGEFKESIRGLIDRFKQLPPPEAPIHSSGSVRHDHIGASTAAERGWSALAAGDWQQAEQLLGEAIERDASHDDAEALLSWALMHQGREDEALEHCLKVLVRVPDHGLARTAVGAICLRKGVTGEAIEHLGRVSGQSSDPRAKLYANYWLGVAYLEREMYGDAVEVLGRAVAIGPNLAEAWAELGRGEWLMGRHPEARSSWLAGGAIRHSPFAQRSRDLLRRAEAGEVIPRSPLE